ncbi:MAG: hypothetical protein IPK32_11550 [Verrucomicrobiaceae bacterium]|nr:hypothetical protein [Verrucomicrobiaceae bacterium]
MAAFPEQQARQTIDAMLVPASWAVQDSKAFDLSTSLGIAHREVSLKSGRCDYLFLVNRKPVGLSLCQQLGSWCANTAEQTRIVAEVERRLSVVKKLEPVVTTNFQRATRLRQSI